MKKLAILAAAAMMTVGAYAQGTVNNANFVSGVLDAPVFDVDGTTRLAGANYMAQLYAGPAGGSLAAIGSPVAFKTGSGAGYFLGGAATIPTVAPGANADIKIVAFQGASEASAVATGSSSVFTVQTGGAGNPPGLPANLVGLTSFSLQVPEPSTIALGILGAAALLLRRRK